jgi:hypothetical protein
METIKKTGATPIIEENVGGAEVIGVVELRAIMVKLRDGNGVEMVKMGFQVPGGEVYFLDEKIISKPAQTWVKNGIVKKLG